MILPRCPTLRCGSGCSQCRADTQPQTHSTRCSNSEILRQIGARCGSQNVRTISHYVQNVPWSTRWGTHQQTTEAGGQSLDVLNDFHDEPMNDTGFLDSKGRLQEISTFFVKSIRYMCCFVAMAMSIFFPQIYNAICFTISAVPSIFLQRFAPGR